ncbi:uncharacterized protein LOC116247983 [Nymphaea colorata]|nr:uncharacterized protein LOC116247983 [Nymphaea colorata]
MRQKDLGWQYCSRISETDRSFVRCNFCQREIHGGISRFKQHIAKLKGECKGCTRVPAAVSREMREYIAGKKLERQQKQESSEKAFDNGNLEMVLKDDGDDIGMEVAKLPGAPGFEEDIATRAERGKASIGDDGASTLVALRTRPALGSSLRAPLNGSLSLDPVIQKSSKQKQKASSVKDARKMVCKAISKFFYHAAIPFHSAHSPYFQPMFDAIAQYGSGVKPPSPYEIGGPLLDEEVETSKSYISELKLSWNTTGCSIMVDGWTDNNGRTLINFLAYCPKGTVFVRSVDASHIINDPQLLFELLSDVVEEVGEKNVVQVITENSANFSLAGSMLMEKRKNLFWTPCAAYCIDQILKEISTMRSVSDALKKGKRITKFIYNHAWVLSVMRRFTEGRELIRPAVTRSAASFLTLESISAARSALFQMFASDEWKQSSFAKLKEGKQVERLVATPKFWSKVDYAVRCTSPLVKALRLIDADDKPTMAYIYDAIDRAKLAIRDANGGRYYKSIWRIIDDKWGPLLHHPLHAAGYYLNPAIRYDQDFSRHPDIVRSLHLCIQRLQPNQDAQLEAVNQAASKYSKALGDFGSDLAIRSRKKMDPAIWWETYSMDCPELRDIAIKVLSQTCLSSGCEWKRSMFDLVHTKRRNRLTTTKLDKLVYVHYNLRLRARQFDRDAKYYNPINLDYIFHEDPTEEWLVEGETSMFSHEQSHVLSIVDRPGSGHGTHMDMNDEDEYICSGDDDDGSDDEDGGNKDEPYEVQPAGDMDEGYYQPPYDYELGDMNLPRQPTWFD